MLRLRVRRGALAAPARSHRGRRADRAQLRERQRAGARAVAPADSEAAAPSLSRRAPEPLPKLNPSRRAAPRAAAPNPSTPFVSTWRDLPPAVERRGPNAIGPRLMLLMTALGGLLLSIVAPLS